jgi:hypothetical protein
MAIEGQVFDLKVATAIGPWSGGMHPGLIVSQTLLTGKDSPVVVVPITGTKPQFSRVTHVEILERHGSLSGPLWVQCEYPITLSMSDFDGLQARCALPVSLRILVRNKLGWYLRVPMAAP